MNRSGSFVRVLIIIFTFYLAKDGAFFNQSYAANSNKMKPAAEVRIKNAYGKLAMRFELNRGQEERWSKFVSRGRGHLLLLDATRAELRLSQANSAPRMENHTSAPGAGRKSAMGNGLRMTFVNANSSAKMVGVDELAGKSNYFVGNDPVQWHTNIPTYAKVKAENLYPGIDLVYYGSGPQLEYDWIVAPWANHGQIRFTVEEAGPPTLDSKGNLIFGNQNGLQLQKPILYQEQNGVREEISGGYLLLANGSVGFRVGSYDRSRPLVIDPVVIYSRYLGTSADDRGFGVAVDSAGNAYVAATTVTTGQGVNVFVAKLDPSGSTLLYSITLGGSAEEQPRSIKVDSGGNAFLVGYTLSSDFPTENALQPNLKGSSDAFVAKVNAAGDSLVFSTYFGGSGTEQAYAIKLDSNNNIYLSGNTGSVSDFPVANAFQPIFGGGGVDAFVAKLNASGTTLIYSSYLGGSGEENGRSIAVDASGNAYVTGRTSSANFPTVSPYQASNGGGYDIFISKISPAGNALVYSTYLGGSGGDVGHGITVDSAGNVYLTGKTSSPNFPIASAFQTSYGGGSFDGIVLKLNASGSGLIFSSYLGGNDDEESLDIALDSFGYIYVAGFTDSTNFPTVNALQATFGGGAADVFVAEVNPSGDALVFSTYLGGNDDDEPYRMAIDSSNNLYIVGWTASLDFPMGDAFQSLYSGGVFDAFITKLEANTGSVFFPQVAVGGGYTGMFSLANTGTTAALGRLVLTAAQGNPMQVAATQFASAGNLNSVGSSFDFVIPAAGTISLAINSLNVSDLLTAGWARFENTGHSVTASEVFEFAPGGNLQALAGVLPSAPVVDATIPVDDDDTQNKQIGYAIANPGDEDISVRLAIVGEDGTLIDDTMTIPLSPGQQIAQFLWQRNSSYLTFRGSMVLRSDPGRPFIAVALQMKRGCFTVIPVIPEKSAAVPD